MLLIVYIEWLGPVNKRTFGHRKAEVFTNERDYNTRLRSLQEPSQNYEIEIHYKGPIEELKYYNPDIRVGVIR